MIRVFPTKNKWTPDDDLAFVGYPPLPMMRPADSCPVRISITFTWDLVLGEKLRHAWSQHYTDVQIGGPALDDRGEDFTPGRFIKEGVTITSRGCPKRCPWCFVPTREGNIRELPIQEGWIVQDNNLLACSETHILEVFTMLRTQSKAAVFSGGLDATLFRDWHLSLLESIRFKELWFACDSPSALFPLKKVTQMLKGISINKLRCFVLMGFQNDETPTQAEDRAKRIYELGFLPFAQLYQGVVRKIYSREWRDVARKWSRPAAYRRDNQQIQSDR